MKQKPVTKKMLTNFNKSYANSKELQLLNLALAKTDLKDAAYNNEGAYKMRHKFSIEIETLPITNQEATGRCWLFAATNVLREKIAKDLGLKNFELSQSYLAFYDKFERANLFLENIIETANLPTDDRNVQFILTTGVHDGGQWEMFANIVRKYGIVPKDVYDETYQSSHSWSMNNVLNKSLKVSAIKIREMIKKGKKAQEIQEYKEEVLNKVYGFLCACYGKPPVSFDFEYVDKKKKYHIVKDLTPEKFYQKYIGNLVDNYVSIINSPTDDKPFHQTYTIRYLGNVVDGKEVKHLNLPMDEFKNAIIKQLKAGKVVWFGSDVGKYGERNKGIWDDNSYKLHELTGLDLNLSKAQGLDYWYAAMNHAMVITGVNIVDGKPNRWKIENSWGDKTGDKGYYICSDTWFDEFVYQAAVEKEYLGVKVAKEYENEPIMLEAWDPMGTLAK